MRIAYILTRSDTIGGAVIHIRDMAASMSALGHETIVFIGGEGIAAKEIEANNIRVQSLRYLQRRVSPLNDFLAIFELRAALKKFAPDIVSAHTSKAGFISRISGWSLRVPTLYTPHCWSFCNAFPKARLYKWMEWIGGFFGPRIISVSQWEKDLAVQMRVIPEKKITNIYNGMPDIPESLRADTSNESPKITMIGRFEIQKNHEMLLRSLSRILDLDWSLDLIGDGPRFDKIQELAQQLGIEDRIHFAGWRTDIAERLSQVQIYALVSKWESFPRSILEAMRAGLPVVTTDAGGSSEAVLDGENGFVIGLQDEEALADRLRRLITDKNLRIRMGTISRDRYEKYFTFDRMCRENLAIYHELQDRFGSFEIARNGLIHGK